MSVDVWIGEDSNILAFGITCFKGRAGAYVEADPVTGFLTPAGCIEVFGGCAGVDLFEREAIATSGGCPAEW
jgi:hypothetical protein